MRFPCRSTSGSGSSSLRIDYPRIVESGLAEHEKRIFVAKTNAARRQLTDAQKVALGKRIEPDVAEVADARRKAALKQGNNAPLVAFATNGNYNQTKTSKAAPGNPATSVTTFDAPSRTTDEVARTVQLGSGRTVVTKPLIPRGVWCIRCHTRREAQA